MNKFIKFNTDLFILILIIRGVHLQERFVLSTSDIFNGVQTDKKLESKPPPTTTTTKPNTTKIPLQKIVCPAEIRIPIFSLPCSKDDDCRAFGKGIVCCKQRCIQGVAHLIAQKQQKQKPRQTNEIEKPQPTKPKFICPGKTSRRPIFSLPCKQNKDCNIFGRGLLCCDQTCLQAIEAPKEEVAHTPALFGLVDRACPVEPIAEILGVKECKSDLECTPRICCPEKLPGAGMKSYCRTPMHKIERLPGAKQIQEPLRNFVSYMQCTKPPPLDLFPKPCNSTLDCFPNLCCQENGKQVCRPPKKSILSLVVDVSTRIGVSEATKRFIERISK